MKSNTEGEVCKGCFQMKPSAQMLRWHRSKKDTRRRMGTICRTCACVSCGLFQDEDGKEQLTRITRWRCEECNVAVASVACKLCMPRVERATYDGNTMTMTILLSFFLFPGSVSCQWSPRASRHEVHNWCPRKMCCAHHKRKTTQQASIARPATIALVVAAGSECRRGCAGGLRVSRFGGVRHVRRHSVSIARIEV